MSESRAECLRGEGVTKVFGIGNKRKTAVDHVAVSYTHLTLPTICSV